MYELVIRSQFAAAHNLRDYGGKCEALHGHNWHVEVVVRADFLGEGGMVVDFRILKEEVEGVLMTLDHTYLNDLPYFQNEEPTTEHIARYIYTALSERLHRYQVTPYKVTAWESDKTGASYIGGEE